MQLDLLPEPYIGRPDAPVVLLRPGPGYTLDRSQLAANGYGREVWRRNLLHQPLDYPFYALDPALTWSAQAIWWRRKLRQVLAVADERTVAGALLSVAAVPYHAYRYPGSPGPLPSRSYSVALVEAAIDRNAIILISNLVRFWHEAAPRLRGYPHLHIARVPRGGHITPGYYPEGFSRLERLFRERA